MAGVLFRLGLGFVVAGVIEAVDYNMDSFSIPWPVSLIAGILAGFGAIEALEELGN